MRYNVSVIFFFTVPLNRGSSRSKRKLKYQNLFLWKWVSSVYEYYIMIWEILILPQFHSCIPTVIVYVGRSNQGISYTCNQKILTFAYCGRFAVPRAASTLISWFHGTCTFLQANHVFKYSNSPTHLQTEYIAIWRAIASNVADAEFIHATPSTAGSLKTRSSSLSPAASQSSYSHLLCYTGLTRSGTGSGPYCTCHRQKINKIKIKNFRS